MDKIFQEYFLDDLVFRLVPIPKSANKFLKNNFKKIHF